jgi:hypothetical protein
MTLDLTLQVFEGMEVGDNSSQHTKVLTSAHIDHFGGERRCHTLSEARRDGTGWAVGDICLHRGTVSTSCRLKSGVFAFG